MKIQLTLSQEAQLSRMANETGRRATDLAREAMDRYLTEEGRFHAGVRAGLDAADRGDFVLTSAVWARVERGLKV